MPIEHYIPAAIYTLLGAATPSLLRLVVPFNGWITEFFARGATGPITSDAIYDINLDSGSGLVSIFGDPDDRPRITAAGSEVTEPLAQVVSKGDVITIDLDTFGAAPIGNPMDLRLTLKQGPTRTSASFVSGSLANETDEDFALPLGFGFVIERVTVDFQAWIRAYNSPAYRTADAGRAIGDAPSGEHGCILDIYFADAGNLGIDISNARFGADLQASPDGSIAFTVRNKSGSTEIITVTVYYLELEL